MQTTDTCDEYTSGTNLSITAGFVKNSGCSTVAFDNQDSFIEIQMPTVSGCDDGDLIWRSWLTSSEGDGDNSHDGKEFMVTIDAEQSRIRVLGNSAFTSQ